MAQPYVGEIRMFAGNFAPAGWQFCDGTLLAISENETLFQLIGTTYGGDGQNTFAVPDLRGRLPLHMGTGGGSSYTIGENGGAEDVTLAVQQIPQHAHPFLGTSNQASGTAPGPSVTYGLAVASTITPYGTDAPSVTLNPQMIGGTGGSQPHTNFQPYLCINFILSLFGIFPSPT